MSGDILYGEVSPEDVSDGVAVDGHLLSPLPKVFRLSEIRATGTKTRVIFRD